MSCQACRDQEAVDGEPRQCEDGGRCPIPPLSPWEARLIEIHTALRRGADLWGAQAVMARYQVAAEEYDAITEYNEQLRALRPNG